MQNLSLIFYKNNPIITEGVARLLTKNRVKMIGIDSFSPDNKPYKVHKILFKKNILIIENLANLERVEKYCQLFVAPLNIQNADGAPCRVIAKA